jgi:hypothetical protein
VGAPDFYLQVVLPLKVPQWSPPVIGSKMSDR